MIQVGVDSAFEIKIIRHDEARGYTRHFGESCARITFPIDGPLAAPVSQYRRSSSQPGSLPHISRTPGGLRSTQSRSSGKSCLYRDTHGRLTLLHAPLMLWLFALLPFYLPDPGACCDNIFRTPLQYIFEYTKAAAAIVSTMVRDFSNILTASCGAPDEIPSATGRDLFAEARSFIVFPSGRAEKRPSLEGGQYENQTAGIPAPCRDTARGTR